MAKNIFFHFFFQNLETSWKNRKVGKIVKLERSWLGDGLKNLRIRVKNIIQDILVKVCSNTNGCGSRCNFSRF